MVFEHLRASANYNKDGKRIVGGINGFGFKPVLIWSSFGSVIPQTKMETGAFISASDHSISSLAAATLYW